jgi:hypothetical protein
VTSRYLTSTDGDYTVCNNCVLNGGTSGTVSFRLSDCQCNAGYYGLGPDAAYSACVACPVGTYKTSTTQCSSCPVNTYAATTANSACLPCYANSLQPTLGSSTCLCNNGYGGAAGGPCTICPPGQTSPGGLVACANCPAGTYGGGASISCTACPKSYQTSPAGSSSTTYCDCIPEYSQDTTACQ